MFLSDFSIIGASFLALYEFYFLFHPSVLANNTTLSENLISKSKMSKSCCGMSLRILTSYFPINIFRVTSFRNLNAFNIAL